MDKKVLSNKMFLFLSNLIFLFAKEKFYLFFVLVWGFEFDWLSVEYWGLCELRVKEKTIYSSQVEIHIKNHKLFRYLITFHQK